MFCRWRACDIAMIAIPSSFHRTCQSIHCLEGAAVLLGFFLSTSLAVLPTENAAPDDSPSDPEEIIITGERTPRTLRETPSSVVVLGAEAIEATGADRLDQLLELVPNVQIGSGEEGPAIRGQDSTGVLRNLFAFLGGTRPRVTLQVDGRPVTYYEYVASSAPLWDVEKVELFRSPQTTTQGRNSIAGAIFVETADPGYEWQGRARILAGSFRTRQASLAVSGPIVADQLAVGISGDLRLSRMASDMEDGIAGADIGARGGHAGDPGIAGADDGLHQRAGLGRAVEVSGKTDDLLCHGGPLVDASRCGAEGLAAARRAFNRVACQNGDILCADEVCAALRQAAVTG